MPLSIAACRTVLPFSTVTCRPSIVSVTVSISLQCISSAGLGLTTHGSTPRFAVVTAQSGSADGRHPRRLEPHWRMDDAAASCGTTSSRSHVAGELRVTPRACRPPTCSAARGGDARRGVGSGADAWSPRRGCASANRSSRPSLGIGRAGRRVDRSTRERGPTRVYDDPAHASAGSDRRSSRRRNGSGIASIYLQ